MLLYAFSVVLLVFKPIEEAEFNAGQLNLGFRPLIFYDISLLTVYSSHQSTCNDGVFGIITDCIILL